MSRKEKRKAMKKMKRKQMRKEAAEREREEDEERLKDPEEQRRIQLLEQEEVERMERERILFEERERAWILQHQHKDQTGDEIDNDEYGSVQEEEGGEEEEERPPQIIWQGNEIIVKKKQVRPRARVRDSEENNYNQGDNTATTNPFPPESFTETLENVAQQVPNFGTEQDKAHCPFHLKTGACRFGVRCSRVHFYPDKSSTLLIKNMYNGPGLAWDQDEGLEYTDEEVECCFEEFYEDVHTEFLKFGEIVNFKVCKNGSFHLRGNVYVQYKLLDSALLAYNSINGRYFAGKQVLCQFVNLTRWKVAICGEYMKSGFKTCSHGTACNFIHCFRNPGGDYEWADSDKPPPKYWVKKMIALFGYSDDGETLMEPGKLSLAENTNLSQTDSDRNHSRKSKSREMDQLNYGRRRKQDEKRLRTPDKECNTNFKDNHKRKYRGRTRDADSDRDLLDKEEDRENCHELSRNSLFNRNKDGNSRGHEKNSDVDWETKENEKQHGGEGRNWRKWNRDTRDRIYEADSNEDRDRKRHRISKRKSSRHRSDDDSESDKDVESQHDCYRKSSRHRRTSLQDDYKYYDGESDKFDGVWSRRESDKREHHPRKKRSKH